MATTQQLQELVSETVIQVLKEEKVPWRSDHGFPRNILSRRRFGGLNSLLLMTAADRHGFPSCFWGTQPEWHLLGGKVTEGPGTQTVLHQPVPGENLRPCTAFNLQQIDGDFPISRSEYPMVDYATVDRTIASTRADIRFTHEAVAECHWKGDFIKLCHKEHFERSVGGIGAYYHAAFHELSHWSEPRLKWFGTQVVEELRAEMVADFLTTELRIPNYPYLYRRNHQTYLGAWIEEMQRSPEMIFRVAEAAARAADFVLSFSGEVEPRHQPV
jgi:antirestriction protein ArdC